MFPALSSYLSHIFWTDGDPDADARDIRHRFNTGEGKDATAIVTSSGEYVIAWDFAQAKKGRTDRYEIKKYVSSPFYRNVASRCGCAIYAMQ